MSKLNQSQIDTELQSLAGWSSKEDWITKEFKFKNFREAISFMLRASFEAEELNHHPNWSNVYSTVQVELQTHTEGGVTSKDIELAKRMNELAG